ncbi:MAG TPA: DUF4846 domain-containing protein [Bacteroidia bacterium]|nr:DUF4846 domain-containing protein [Bacteroidia bacterium]
MKIILLSFLGIFCFACNDAESRHQALQEKFIALQDSSCNNCFFQYSWMDFSDYKPNSTVCSRFEIPQGYVRVKNKKGSFGEWLRGLPLLPEGTQVKLFNGELKSNQGAQAAVINIDVGNKDLQQCADAVMRLRAEYLFATKQYEKIAFNYTSGDRLDYSGWVNGKRIEVNGNKTSVVFSGKKYPDISDHRVFREYMNDIFNYAGTLSLTKEMKSIPTDSLQPGDVFIHGGSPGHAVLIVDVAVSTETGDKIFMIAQSYMPAQQIHVLKNDNDKNISPWYKVGSGRMLESPEYVFDWSELKRF